MHKCECPNLSVVTMPISWYEPEEYKALNHEPNKCPGDYEMEHVNRNGKIMWLCSACTLPGDINVDEGKLN